MDLVAILTDHSAFDYAMVAEFSPLIFDTRNALKDTSRGNVALCSVSSNSNCCLT